MQELNKKVEIRMKVKSFALMICQPLMMTVVMLLWGILVLNNNAYAIGYGISKDMLIELQISTSAPTRVQIDGEKITDIYVHPQSAIEAVIHPSGCLMVLPQPGEEKVFITVFGENETVQDLSLRFTEKSPSPIRLIKFNLEKELADQQTTALVNSPNSEEHKFLISNDQKTKENNKTNNKK